RLQALLALGDVERHLLAFLELTEPLGGDVRVVGEDVGSAAVLLDEAEALFRVEPLHGAGGHDLLFLVDPGRTPCAAEDAAMAHPENPDQQKMRPRSDPTGA